MSVEQATAADALAKFAEQTSNIELLVTTAARNRQHIASSKQARTAMKNNFKKQLAEAREDINTAYSTELSELETKLAEKTVQLQAAQDDAVAAKDADQEAHAAALVQATSASTVNWKNGHRDYSHDMERCVWSLMCSGVPQTRVLDVLKSCGATLPFKFDWLPSQGLVNKMADELCVFALAHAGELLLSANESGDVLSMMFDGTNKVPNPLRCPALAARHGMAFDDVALRSCVEPDKLLVSIINIKRRCSFSTLYTHTHAPCREEKYRKT